MIELVGVRSDEAVFEIEKGKKRVDGETIAEEKGIVKHNGSSVSVAGETI